MENNKVLVMDIETKTFGKPDITKDRLKLFGCYSYLKQKPYIVDNVEDTQKIINAHKFLVGFNNQGTKMQPGYDNPILKREGVNLKYKRIIDMRNIFKSRASQMKIQKGMLGDLIMSYSLNYITKLLGIVSDEDGKKEIDYSVFRKDVWTPEEKKEIYEYTKRDIIVTKKLYEWLENYFSGFKHYLNKEDADNKIYLTASLAKVVYKAYCKGTNVNEDYGQSFDNETSSGGYTSHPAGEKFENVILLDFTSLYPHVIIMCALLSRVKELSNRPKWFGSNVWKTHGEYYSDKLSDGEELIKKWFNDRLEFKKVNDPREYSIKIFINIISGLLDNPYYSQLYDTVARNDCTELGQQWIHYTRKIFRENGYINCYSDTDSVYIQDPFNDKEKVLKIKNQIIDYIKSTVPFPQDTFDMDLEAEIKYLYFFKGGNKDSDNNNLDEDDFVNKSKGLMKKNYIYVSKIFDSGGNYTGEDKVVIKNLGIKKKSNSALSKKIFWEYMVPEIKKGTCKFSKTWIKNLIMELIQKDINLAVMRKEVGDYSQYERTSPNSMPAQIAKRYGPGIHFLIPNTMGLGVGKGKKFCTLEEFKKRGLRYEHIDLVNIWKELNHFIKPVVSKNIFEF